ncbi:MAG: prepilin-type N-terminal cleavage/methylation domain-containing protein [Proteobacteria bacterium]|nr:prepilin-type N-terminal cleavage/methylation domain-containing protein [Pseudomonadota bacterium]
MKRQRGFTLIEVVVVIAIVGILSATAIPFYNTYRMRTYGSEAKIMMKQILNAEVAYYLENDTFYPPNFGDWIVISHNSAINNPADIALIKQALNITIPEGHNLDFTFQRLPHPTSGVDAVWVTINSYKNSFPLFGGGATSITGILDSNGQRVVF